MHIPTLLAGNLKKVVESYRGNCSLLHNCSNYSLPLKRHKPVKFMSEKDVKRQLQKMRREKHAKFERTSPSTVTLQVLGSGTPGAPASLYVSTDHSKYLFNCGEGTQRLAHEHHLRLTKLEHVFFTTPTWSNMGGLPGMALTIQDTGVPKITLHGPKGIADIFDAVKKFAFLAHLNVLEANCDEEVYEDPCMRIRYVPLLKDSSDSDSDTPEDFVADETDYYAHEVNANGKRWAKQKSQNEKIPKIEHKTNMRKVRGCMAYICKLHPKLGKLDLEKCVEKGVTPGPILGALKAGKDVTLPDGTLIRSCDVVQPDIPGPVFIVLECPNEDYLDSLVSNPTFAEYQSQAEDEGNWASCVIHFTPEDVLRTSKYREWLEKFPKSTEHLIMNSANSSYVYEAIHKIQHKLNLVHPTIFPIIPDSTKPEISRTSETERESGSEKTVAGIRRAKTLNAVHLRPAEGFDETEVKLDRKADIDEAFHMDGFLDALAELQTDINARTKTLKGPEYPKILVLGTGSCIPSKVRNTSGLLLQVDPETSILLDCGEGTVGQIMRFFGPEDRDRIFKTIKGIYVSHLHADHHLGLISMLQVRHQITTDPLFLIAPKQIYSWLQTYHQKFEHINDSFRLIPNQGLIINKGNIQPSLKEQVQKSLKIQGIQTVEVNHCMYSFGVSLTLESGEKIVYSGDTKPCCSLVDLGKNCDLLIHEATMEDRMEKEARAKLHSTISQAIKIGSDMNSKFTLLTHFSQRYSKIPILPETSTERFENVGIAFDNMYVSLSELPLLPLFYPTLKILFSESVMLLEEKAMKKLLREENDGS